MIQNNNKKVSSELIKGNNFPLNNHYGYGSRMIYSVTSIYIKYIIFIYKFIYKFNFSSMVVCN